MVVAAAVAVGPGLVVLVIPIGFQKLQQVRGDQGGSFGGRHCLLSRGRMKKEEERSRREVKKRKP